MNAKIRLLIISLFVLVTVLATMTNSNIAYAQNAGDNASVLVYVNADGTITMVADRPELYVQGDEVPNQTLTGTPSNGKYVYHLPATKKSVEVKNAASVTFPEGGCKLTAGTTWFACEGKTTSGTGGAAPQLPATTVNKPAATPAPSTTTMAEYDLNGNNGQWVDGGMWHVVPETKMMYWTGGTSWVHVNFNEEAKNLLLAGYTAEFTMNVQFETRACRSYWEGVDANGNVMNKYIPADCEKATFRPGTYRVNGWAFDEYCLIQVGFRAIPSDAAPWDEQPTCDKCVWPFPVAHTQPTYRDPVAAVVPDGNPPENVTDPTTITKPSVWDRTKAFGASVVAWPGWRGLLAIVLLIAGLAGILWVLVTVVRSRRRGG